YVPQIFVWGGVMIIGAVVAILGNIIANRKAAKVARDTTEALRHDVFIKIGRLSCSQTDRITIPSLISRLSSDSYNVHQMIGMMQRLGVRAPILLIGGIMVTFTLEPYLTLVLVAILPLLAAAVYIVSKKGIPLYADVQRAVDSMVGKVQENMVGVRVIKALSKSDYERNKFDEVSSEVVRREQKAGIIMSATNPIMNFLLNTGLAAVIVVGAYRVNGGVSQPGKIIAFLSYFTIILNAMLSITRLFINFSKGAASAQRISDVLAENNELPTKERSHIDTEDYISFENVNFSYNKAAGENGSIDYNLTDISFGVRRGGMIGIIGATGSGKSTVINLLLRYYDPDSGTIRIGGDDIRGIPPAELYAHIGIAFQNDFLFADTIAENINFGRGISDENIKRAARAAQAEDFISEKPDGYDYVLTVKGANLSGGQKQRLLIARALAANPDILILDDSSSALDYKTDASLRRAIKSGYPDVTSVIIAQRVSSIMAADVIIMLDDGNVIGMGTHETMLRECESYREIAFSQMGEEAAERV
ncbi:MAG: ABC transporter ATP-binding protein, partial [Eubacteriales bacterium]